MNKEKENKNLSKEQEEPENEKGHDSKHPKEEQKPESEQPMVALTFEEYEALEKKIEALQGDVEEQKDGWLRSRADLDNYRKRVQRDAARSHQDALSSVIKIFLDVADDLERALRNKPETEESENWVVGIALIHQKLLTKMKNQGVERMEVNPGDEFDPNIHEAITQEESPDFEEGQIIDVVKPGYRISDRVIRPAMVRVAR